MFIYRSIKSESGLQTAATELKIKSIEFRIEKNNINKCILWILSFANFKFTQLNHIFILIVCLRM